MDAAKWERSIPFCSVLSVILYFFQVEVLQGLYYLIERHGNDAEDNDGCNYHMELEEVGSANDKKG